MIAHIGAFGYSKTFFNFKRFLLSQSLLKFPSKVPKCHSWIRNTSWIYQKCKFSVQQKCIKKIVFKFVFYVHLYSHIHHILFGDNIFFTQLINLKFRKKLKIARFWMLLPLLWRQSFLESKSLWNCEWMAGNICTFLVQYCTVCSTLFTPLK